MFSDIKLYSTNVRTVDLNDLKGKPAKQLFYNKEEKGQIERLGSLLEEESLQKIFSSIKEKDRRRPSLKAPFWERWVSQVPDLSL
jgi:hypothetical protein